MQSWVPKPLCILQSASHLHGSTARRIFHIKRHLVGASEDAAKTAAQSSAPAKEAHPSQLILRSSRHNLPTEAERAGQPPPDRFKKVFIEASEATKEKSTAHKQRHQKSSEFLKRGRYNEGKRLIRKISPGLSEATQRKIAAHDQRHQKLIESLNGGHDTKVKGVLKGRGRKGRGSKGRGSKGRGSKGTVEKFSSHTQNQKRVAQGENAAQEEAGGSGREFPRQKYPRAPVRSLDSTGKPSDSSKIGSGGQPRIRFWPQPTQSQTREHSASDGQRPEDAKPIFLERANPWSRMSSRNAEQVRMRSEFDPVVADEAPKVAAKQDKDPSKVLKRRLSLFEELFPEEVGKHDSTEEDLQQEGHDVPKLALPELIENNALDDEYMKGRKLGFEQRKAATEEGFRVWNPSVLVLQAASPSLVDSDFRRIAPKGKHINEWTGPGDYFKGDTFLPAQPLPPMLTTHLQ